MSAILVVALSAVVSCQEQPVDDGESQVLVLTSATVIDGTESARRADAVVAIVDGRIEHGGELSNYNLPSSATVLDLEGRWLIPGGADMHAHLPGTEDQQPAVLRRLLSFGITTLRNTAAEPAAGVPVRLKWLRANWVGPRYFFAGPLLDAPNGIWDWAAVVETEEDVREEVRRQAEEGVDFIKLYFGLSRDLVRVGIEEAHAHALKANGHLGPTSWAEAAELGIDSLVHSWLYGPTWEISTSREIQTARDWRTADLSTLDFHGPTAVALAESLREHEVVVGPNLVLTEAVFWGDDPTALARLEPEVGPERLPAGGAASPTPTALSRRPKTTRLGERCFLRFSSLSGCYTKRESL